MKKLATYLLSIVVFGGAIALNNINGANASTLNFINPGGVIADDSSTDFTFNVTGFTDSTEEVNLTISSLTHPDLFDLELFLISPTGQVLTLAQALIGDTLTQTRLSDTGDINIDLGDAPYTGTFAPSGELGFAQNSNISSFGGLSGFDPNGTWTLRIYDTLTGNVGTLSNVTLAITGPVQQQPVDVPESQPVNLLGAAIALGLGFGIKRSQII